MQVAQTLSNNADAPVQLHAIGGPDRARVSGPGLRTFRQIADGWGLTEKQRIAVLGEPARSTYHLWMKKAAAGDPVTLPLDTLLRISGVLGIHKSLTILFADRGEALAWLTGPHRGTVFRGAAPHGLHRRWGAGRDHDRPALSRCVAGWPSGPWRARRQL